MEEFKKYLAKEYEKYDKIFKEYLRKNEYFNAFIFGILREEYKKILKELEKYLPKCRN